MNFQKNIAIAIVCFSSLTTTSVIAQNYAQDMGKIRESYKKGSLSFNMKYVYYPYDSIKRATDSLHGTCSISGDFYYYTVANGTDKCEYLKNEKYYMVIDNSNKAIAVNYSSKAQQDLWNIDKVDSMLKNPGIKVGYKLLGKEKAQYVLRYAKGSVWARIRIVFDKANYILSEVWFYSDAKGTIQGESYNKPKIGIFYSAFKETIPDKNIFSEKKYIEDSGKEIVLKGEYRKYRLLNYMRLEKKS